MSDDEFDFRAWRERIGLSREQIAEEFDVSPAWIKSAELGLRGPPGRVLEYACLYIDRALEKPDPALGLLTKADVMARFDAIQAQLRAMAGARRRTAEDEGE